MSATRRQWVLRVVLTTAALGWVVLLGLTPGWSRETSGAQPVRATTAALVRSIGSRVCHQRPDRSFHLAGRPLAVCGRCTGLYVSGAVGLLAAGMGGPRRRRSGPAAKTPAWWPTRLDPRARWLALAALPTVVTWMAEVGGLWTPGTPLRALAAIPLGLAAGWFVGRALH